MIKDRVTPVMFVLVGLLLLLLALLGWLQYRWVGQVSESHRERLQVNLRADASRFGEDFNRELARVYLHFQVDTAMLQDRSWQQFAQRYAYWQATSPYPQLVKDVLLVEADAAGHLSLSRFDSDAAGFAPYEWPAEMAGWQQRFAQQYQQVRVEAKSLARSQLELVAADIPAVVIPLSDVSMLQKRESGDAVPAFGYTVVRLDRDYLRQQFIPTLVQRHFAHGGELDYNLLVVNRSNPQEIVYQSDARVPRQQFAAGDAAVNIFGVQLSSFLNLSMDGTLRNENIPGGGRLPLTSLAVSVLRSPPNNKTPADANALGGDNGQWTLILKHRAGSLDAAVSRLRTQNLLISFGILLLLGVSVAMIMISAQRAQRLASQQIEFVAAVSHELRTPLAVIYSAGENLADGLVAEPQQVRRYGRVIRSEGRRLTGMVEQVLEFAGMQSGRKAFQRCPLRVDALIEEALADYQTLIAEQGFQIERQIEPGLPLLLADARALKRAIQNLLNNAMKYSGEHRSIKIGASAAARESEVRITVVDKGLGVEPSELPHIFEPFYRGREITAAQIHGSGLGLSLLKHIVEAHDGRVSVESAPGRGSSFTIHLPTIPDTTQIEETTGEAGEPTFDATRAGPHTK